MRLRHGIVCAVQTTNFRETVSVSGAAVFTSSARG